MSSEFDNTCDGRLPARRLRRNFGRKGRAKTVTAEDARILTEIEHELWQVLVGMNLGREIGWALGGAASEFGAQMIATDPTPLFDD